MDGQDAADRPSFFRKPASGASPVLHRPVAAPPPAPPAEPPPPGPPEHLPGPPPEGPGLAALRRPTFHGTGGTLFGIHLVNTLLTIVTLGFYYFWAKTRLRRYLFGQSEIEGDRYAYHGTGPELLLGTIKAVLVFGVPIL